MYFKWLTNSLYLFRIVASVTPAAIEISFWVRLSPSCIAATYNAAPARPVGAFPAVIRWISANSRIDAALFWVLPDNFKSAQNRGMKFIGEETWIFNLSSFKINL